MQTNVQPIYKIIRPLPLNKNIETAARCRFQRHGKYSVNEIWPPHFEAKSIKDEQHRVFSDAIRPCRRRCGVVSTRACPLHRISPNFRRPILGVRLIHNTRSNNMSLWTHSPLVLRVGYGPVFDDLQFLLSARLASGRSTNC